MGMCGGFRPTGAVVVFVFACVFASSACVDFHGSGFPWKWTTRPQGRQYILKLDARDATQHQVCYREADQDPASAPLCRPFTGEALDTPATLTVVVQNRDLSKTYDLRVSSFTTEADPKDVSALVDKVLGNVQQLATLGAAKGKEALTGKSEAAAKVVEKLTAKVIGEEGELAARFKRVAGVKDAVAAEPHDPAVLFEEYLDGARLRGPADVTGDRTPTNAPTIDSPPARAIEYTAEDVLFLLDPKRGVPIAALADHTVAWCAPASFNTTAIDWQQRFASQADLDPTALSTALGLTAAAIAKALLTDSKELEARQNQLLDLAITDYAAAPPAAKTYFLMHWSISIEKDLVTCLANLAFVEPQVLTAAGRAAIQQARKAIEAFQKLIKPATDVFVTYAPVFRDATRRVEAILALNGETFASFSLQPGTIDLGLGEKTGADRREIGTFKLDVEGVERFAITVGPAMLWCKSCFEKLEIKTSPAVDGEMASRQLVRTRDSRQYAVVAALHATMYSTRRIGAGFLLGYPITQPGDTAKSALLGFGLRRWAIQLGLGVHVFSVRKLIPEYDRGAPIDLDVPGNQALTADDVSTEQLGYSWFAYLGYSKSL